MKINNCIIHKSNIKLYPYFSINFCKMKFQIINLINLWKKANNLKTNDSFEPTSCKSYYVNYKLKMYEVDAS